MSEADERSEHHGGQRGRPGRRREADGVVIVRANFTGIPTLAAWVDGLPEMLAEGGGNCWFCDSPGAYAERLMWLADHPDDWAAVADIARLFATETFDLRLSSGDLTAVFQAARAAHRACHD